MRVLIVEDDVIIAMHIAMMVTDFGYQVCATAASANEAIDLAAMHNPDIALMDLRLSGAGTGIDAARELHGRYALRCIIVSANIEETTRLALSAYEPIAFVEKPILPVSLERALEEAKNVIDL